MDPREQDELSDELPGLPALDDEGGEEGIEDSGAWRVALPDAGGDPFDDSYASDVPLDFELSEVAEAGSAVGDDSLGIEDGDAQLVPMSDHEGAGSLIDDGAQEVPLFEGDEELGIDPIPREVDDGGLEGLEDASAEMVDLNAFPPLDGTDEDGDEAVDVGLELPGEMPSLDEPE